MTSPDDRAAAAPAAPGLRSDRRLTRSITVTWWYTVSAIVFFELMLVLMTVSVLHLEGFRPAVVRAVAAGGLLWLVATGVALVAYRHRTDSAPLLPWRSALLPLSAAVVLGALGWASTGIWIVAVTPVVQVAVMLDWAAGIRLRVVVAATALLTVLASIDARSVFTGGDSAESNWPVMVVYSVLLPGVTVLSLWWWDVLARLDRARAAESRLGATQERLRVATDVHDLQGHHLQVIALQLELAERLIDKGRAGAALEQVRAARTSVAAAQQGTRDLATRFRGVPLEHEIANAVDLLRAAGTTAEATIDPDSRRAPADVLGPVIRETTTNVLRHGGGRWARLLLTGDGAGWRYEITNDASSPAAASEDGSGLTGIARRVAEAGGEVRVERGRSEFTVTVRVPATGRPAGPVTVPAEGSERR
ncbi:sensor histidine kinase [Pseudactinotalea sp. HY160]|uniref:sensor histidine kinase n=1 Tax=Pseudactinotalea sp. HY160 TaxID=2654490 RepID=UPI00351BA357